MKVEFNQKSENPFYGLEKCFNLFQNNETINSDNLNAAYNEVKGNKQKLEMFYSLLFSIGDIANREHNIFKGVKKDNGGMSKRESFFTIVRWMQANHYDQFLKFLNAGLFNEYNCFDTLFRNRVKTDKRTNILTEYSMLKDPRYRKDLANYLYKIINGNNPFNKTLVAKFLSIPRLSKRKGHNKMLPQTFQCMKYKAEFLKELSDLMHWEYQYSGSYANFKGYRAWRKEYNQDLESVLFSTGKIKEFTKPEFLDWYDKLPAGARFRVNKRIIYSETSKWAPFNEYIEEWAEFKTKKQTEQRVLEEKVRQGIATEKDVKDLEKVKKEAKVTIGATNFGSLYKEILNGSIDNLKLESFINKVNLPYNSLVIIDDSGSMSGAPFNFATFLASVCLYKNPDDNGRNLLGFFNDKSRLYQYIDKRQTDSYRNVLWRNSYVEITPKPFIDPTKSFSENYYNINDFCRASFKSGCTNISSIPSGFKKMCDKNPQFLDALKNYPVWTIISDGEWNNMYSPEASIKDFMNKCEHYFGYKPFIIAIDVLNNSHLNKNRFGTIDNMMYIPSGEINLIEQVLCNFKDMDRFDVYLPLESLWKSNRYELVRNNVL